MPIQAYLKKYFIRDPIDLSFYPFTWSVVDKVRSSFITLKFSPQNILGTFFLFLIVICAAECAILDFPLNFICNSIQGLTTLSAPHLQPLLLGGPIKPNATTPGRGFSCVYGALTGFCGHLGEPAVRPTVGSLPSVLPPLPDGGGAVAAQVAHHATNLSHCPPP